ncbi:family 2 glycosyl transferase [Bacillus freudenreichii]|nr:family 2 glycosyl transferase [Bacillus freudenreichii]
MADVGIVMPVYKQDDKIFMTAIDSILNQNYRNFQMVIVIDGVTPNVVNIANHYAKKDKRIRLIPRIYNNGTATALNIGFNFLMKQSNIKFLTWVSSDNIYYPNFLYVLRKQLITSQPEVGLAYGSHHFINTQGRKIYKNYNLLYWQNQTKENLVDYYFIGYAFMYKKEFAEKIEGYKYTPVEDLDYFLRLTELCEITFVPQKLMEFRLNSPQSNSIKIKNSEEMRRKRRYLMYLVMTEALKRRNISPELTIIYLVDDSSLQSKQTLESILDQFFSNYKLIIYDVSRNQEFSLVIDEIPDVRIQYFSGPGHRLENILLKSLELANTKFIMFFRSENFFENFEHLKEMLASVHTTSFESPVLLTMDSLEFGKIYPKDALSSLM